MILEPPDLVSDIERRIEQRAEKTAVAVFWCRMEESRSVFAAKLRDLHSTFALIPIIVKRGFLNPNELMVDLVNVIEDNRETLVAADAPTPEKPIVLILLSLSEFQLSQVSSPATMPSWFPGIGGENVLLWIEDLTWIVEVALNNTEATRINELSRAIHGLDLAITIRLLDVAYRDHNLGAGWFQEVRQRLKVSDEKFQDFLVKADQLLRSISDPNGYRLDLRRTPTPLACGVRIVSQTAPDQLGVVAKALVRGFGATDMPRTGESLATLMACSTNEETDAERIWGRNLLLMAYASHRLLTASAHSDRYPRYPIALLRSMSLDLRRGLVASAEIIADMSHGPHNKGLHPARFAGE